jgi:hypothetical protein
MAYANTDLAVYTIVVRVPDSTTIVAGPVVTGVVPGRRYEWILVGSARTNARRVTLKRRVDFGF